MPLPLTPKLDGRRTARYTPEQRRVLDDVLRSEIGRRDWYHAMDLGGGVVTPGFPFHALWDNLRRVRSGVALEGASVLDLATYDGMWAFEAEALGAGLVVAVDCCEPWRMPDHATTDASRPGELRPRLRYQGHENFTLVREALCSDVVGYFNVPMNDLVRRLDGVLVSHPKVRDGFDVVQLLGVLYHVRDPMLTLAQARSVMRDGGTLLLETGVYNASEECALFFNRDFRELFEDVATWWLPTFPALEQMLRHSLFDIDHASIERLPQGGGKTHDRIALRATARPATSAVAERYYLDPGFGHGFDPALFRRGFGPSGSGS